MPKAKQIKNFREISEFPTLGGGNCPTAPRPRRFCHFNNCPLIWLFCSTTSQKKLEKVNERALRLVLSDYTLSYKDLLVNAESTTIHIHSIRLLALEIYKTLHNLNPAFMKNYFIPKPTSYNLRINDVLSIPKVKTTNYGMIMV